MAHCGRFFILMNMDNRWNDFRLLCPRGYWQNRVPCVIFITENIQRQTRRKAGTSTSLNSFRVELRRALRSPQTSAKSGSASGGKVLGRSRGKAKGSCTVWYRTASYRERMRKFRTQVQKPIHPNRGWFFLVRRTANQKPLRFDSSRLFTGESAGVT